mgnify:CR=1 FL=1
MNLRTTYRDWQEAVRAIVTQLQALFGAENTWSAKQVFSGGLEVSGTKVAEILTATAALDFGIIAAAASADLTITVTGAAVNDGVILGLPAAPTAGIVYQAFVSATNTVTVRATNITAAAIDPLSQTFRVTTIGY